VESGRLLLKTVDLSGRGGSLVPFPLPLFPGEGGE
jgi:hypothetical protein